MTLVILPQNGLRQTMSKSEKTKFKPGKRIPGSKLCNYSIITSPRPPLAGGGEGFYKGLRPLTPFCLKLFLIELATQFYYTNCLIK